MKLTAFFFVCLICVSLSAQEYSVEPLSEAIATEYNLDQSFYRKSTMAEGILIATSENVSDTAHLEAAWQFSMIMKSIRPSIADSIREAKVLCLLIGHKELTSELPQFGSDRTGEELDFYNWRNRGFLTRKQGRPVVVFAEEDVLEYDGGMQLESILIHEFGHVIQNAGFDKGLQDRLTECFERAREDGLWNDGRAAQRYRRIKGDSKVSLFESLLQSFPAQSPDLLKACLDGGDILVNGKPTHASVQVSGKDKVLITFGGEKRCYASRNKAEYWAEGVQCWYNTNRTMDHDHNHIHTRAQLKEYDVRLAQLCSDVLGDSGWRFVSPRRRAGKGHLKGFNPSDAPVVADLPHIEKAALDYYDEYWRNFWQRLRNKYQIAAHPVPEDEKWLTYRGGAGPGKGRHIVLVAAEQEYRSEQSLPMLAKILSRRHGFDCTVLFGMNSNNEVDPTMKIRWEDKTVTHNIPGLQHLEKADLLILFTRLLTLPDEQVKHITRWLDTGKPIIGIRTANHGFLENFPYTKDGRKVRFGDDVLGGSFRGHHGNWHADSTRGAVVEAAKDHPILRGVKDVWGPSDVYRNHPEGRGLPDGCTALMLGQPLLGRQPGDKPNPRKEPLPIAWTKTWTGNTGRTARVFHVTMGSGRDFQSAGLRRMTINSVYWCLEMEEKIEAESDVRTVGAYNPLASGFNYRKLGVKPQKPDAYK